MSDTVIQVEQVSKLFQLGANRAHYATLREQITNAARDMFGDRSKPAATEILALDNVSFDVRQGEVLGIIGRNGAGKSTLLKLLSNITRPTKGRIVIQGRVGSMLEVGTGFHPELTGRENIFFNGAILGMSRAEIARKFDEIVDFSGVEKFIDTPLKRYSSGMQVRLAFAVAAHLEPEILLVDEVLAVGDIAFQKKSLGKMHSVAGEGRTVLFVSHNMSVISELCERTIVLEQGKIVLDGPTKHAVQTYLSETMSSSRVHFAPDDSKDAQFTSLAVLDENDEAAAQHPYTSPVVIEIEYSIDKPVTGCYVALEIRNSLGVPVLWENDIEEVDDTLELRQPGKYRARVIVPPYSLSPDSYSCTAAIVSLQRRDNIDTQWDAISFDIVDDGSLLGKLGLKHPAVTMIPLEWHTVDIT